MISNNISEELLNKFLDNLNQNTYSHLDVKTSIHVYLTKFSLVARILPPNFILPLQCQIYLSYEILITSVMWVIVSVKHRISYLQTKETQSGYCNFFHYMAKLAQP